MRTATPKGHARPWVGADTVLEIQQFTSRATALHGETSQNALPWGGAGVARALHVPEILDNPLALSHRDFGILEMTSMIVPAHAKLKEMTDVELIEKIDKTGASTVIGINFLYDELRNREMARLNSKMVKLTWVVTIATVVVTVATVLNLYLVYKALL